MGDGEGQIKAICKEAGKIILVIKAKWAIYIKLYMAHLSILIYSSLSRVKMFWKY
jgi:hypothetical protein